MGGGLTDKGAQRTSVGCPKSLSGFGTLLFSASLQLVAIGSNSLPQGHVLGQVQFGTSSVSFVLDDRTPCDSPRQ